MSAAPSPEVSSPLPHEKKLTPPMFVLSVVFLIVLGGLLHRHKLPQFGDVQEAALAAEGGTYDPYNTELLIQIGILACLWPIFWIEGLARFFLARPVAGWWPPLWDLLVVSLVPPLRMGQRSQGPGHELWLPWHGWRPVNRELQRTLERDFGLPMIGVALLVLPLLAAEWFFHDAMEQHFWIQFLVEFGNALVWFAFTIEFIVMLAVARRKWIYCVVHWIDLIIILAPFVAFLPVLRLLRLGRVIRLEQLSRLGRLYRMQGVALRAWRGFLLLELINRILGTTPEKHLEQLRELEEAKQEELAELRREIAALEEEIRQKQAQTQTPAS
jgi:voltage-gated potassium channel